MSSTWIARIAACLVPALGWAAEPLQTFKNCTFVPTDWADGDSFSVRFPDGTEHTIRLHGADCIEWHVSDATDERRLREQRRYFGITTVAPTPRESIDIAKNFGKQAAEETARLLAEPFTVHTAFRDALGDGKHSRIYGFITCHDGGDLATRLVEAGLARARGVFYATPDGRTADEAKEHLTDLELRAAKRGRGIWAKTDWEKLPDERRDQRNDEAETALSLDNQPLAPGQKIDLNTASRDELMKLPGIGEVLANRIIEKRPYQKTSDLLEVDGISPNKLEKLTPHLAPFLSKKD